jgi:hypothetical protein
MDHLTNLYRNKVQVLTEQYIILYERLLNYIAEELGVDPFELIRQSDVVAKGNAVLDKMKKGEKLTASDQAALDAMTKQAQEKGLTRELKRESPAEVAKRDLAGVRRRHEIEDKPKKSTPSTGEVKAPEVKAPEAKPSTPLELPSSEAPESVKRPERTPFKSEKPSALWSREQYQKWLEARRAENAPKAKPQASKPTPKAPPVVAEPKVAPTTPTPPVAEPAKPGLLQKGVEKVGTAAEKVAGALENETMTKTLKQVPAKVGELAGEAAGKLKTQFPTPVTQYPKALGKEVGGAIKSVFTKPGAAGLVTGLIAGEVAGAALDKAADVTGIETLKSGAVKTPVEWGAMGAVDAATQLAMKQGIKSLGTRAALSAAGGGAVAGAGLAAAAYGGYEVGKAIGQSQPVQKFAEKLGGIETIRKTEGKSAEEINKEAEEIKRKAAEARKSKKPSETTKSWTDYLPDLSGFLPS